MMSERSRPSASGGDTSRRRPSARASGPRLAWVLSALLVLTAGLAALVDLADPPSPADRRASTERLRQAPRRPSMRSPSAPSRQERELSKPQPAAAPVTGLDATEPALRSAQRPEPELQLGWLAFGAEVIDPSLAPTGEDTGIIIVPRGPSAGDPDKEEPPSEAIGGVAPDAVERVEYQPAPERPRSHRNGAERRPDPGEPVAVDTGSVVTPAKAQDEQKK